MNKKFWLLVSLNFILVMTLIIEYKIGSGRIRIQEQIGMTQIENTTADQAVINHPIMEKKIAITFDDGPNPSYTMKLLEGLRERGVRATFFLMGQNIQKYPEIVELMYEDGHLIGNHTYTHMQLTSQNQNEFVEELQKTDLLVYEITGEHTEYVRPPFGIWDSKLEEQVNMLPVLWTIDPQDWCTMDAGAVTSRVTQKADENGIILLHDCYATSVEAALRIIDELSAQGYQFVTVDEIIME